jgi:hypothetical protein
VPGFLDGLQVSVGSHSACVPTDPRGYVGAMYIGLGALIIIIILLVIFVF